MYLSCDLNDVNKPFSWFGWFAIWFNSFGTFPILKNFHGMNGSNCLPGLQTSSLVKGVGAMNARHECCA